MKQITGLDHQGCQQEGQREAAEAASREETLN